MATATLSRTPVADGPRYCAPACGHGCTRKEHDEAVERSASLAKLLGRGWKPRVWENLGWHYSAQKQGMEVHPSTVKGEYFVIFNTAAGHPNVSHDVDPRRLVAAALQEMVERAKGVLEQCQRVIR